MTAIRTVRSRVIRTVQTSPRQRAPVHRTVARASCARAVSATLVPASYVCAHERAPSHASTVPVPTARTVRVKRRGGGDTRLKRAVTVVSPRT